MTKENKNETTIEKIYFTGGQSLEYREIFKNKVLDNRVIKISIKSDSYKQQCYAKAEVLKDDEWVFIYSIPYSLMQTPEGLKSYPGNNRNPEAAAPEFQADIKKIKETIEKILF